MSRRWMFATEYCGGPVKAGTNMMYGELAGCVNYVLPAKAIGEINESDWNRYNLILVGKVTSNAVFKELILRGCLNVPDEAESYGIYVGEGIARETQIIAVAGRDESGVLYGCIDFCNKYCGNVLYRNGDLWDETFFQFPLTRPLNTFAFSGTPAIKTRAVWTWGHVIYDYRSFFKNMARLRLNEAVIWNDCVPLNAREVVENAHSLGIKLIWGFAWGWDTDCVDILQKLDESSLARLKEKIVSTYKTEYMDTGGDGIYFQSFTELHTEAVDGKCIAELVVALVNEVAAELFAVSPELHIQFGLHATSVKNHLDVIRKVDSRIYIVWEDCGAFPYHYYPDATEDFEQTAELTGKLVELRGRNERFGAVFKGMLKLDWTRFAHFTSPYILGERASAFMQERLITKNKIWKRIQADWLRNAEYVRRMTALIAAAEGERPVLQALIEDAMLESKIMFPAALYAEILWTPDRSIQDMIGEVAGYPCVEFASE